MLRRIFGISKIKTAICKLICRLYWKYGRPYDGNDFWKKFVVYYVPANIEGKIFIAQLNDMMNKLDLKEEFTLPIIGHVKGGK